MATRQAKAGRRAGWDGLLEGGRGISTHGFINFVAESETKSAHSYWDSGPYDLGLRVLRWLRSVTERPAQLRAVIGALTVVSDELGPPPRQEEVSRFRQYSDPGLGDPATEWRALLRDSQGDPAAVVACGYVVEDDEPFGWIYEVNADKQSFSVGYDDELRFTWAWDALPAEAHFLEQASQLDPNY